MRRIVLTLALVVATPAVPQTAPARVVLVQAGQALDRPGKPARGPSTTRMPPKKAVTVSTGSRFASRATPDRRAATHAPGTMPTTTLTSHQLIGFGRGAGTGLPAGFAATALGLAAVAADGAGPGAAGGGGGAGFHTCRT